MTIDKDIKAELAQQASEIDRLMQNEPGLARMLRGGFHSGMRHIMVIAYLLALSLTVVLLVSGYHFFTVVPAEQLFWGVILLLAFQAQVAVKIWIWLEMSRSSTVRELKRLELLVEQHS